MSNVNAKCPRQLVHILGSCHMDSSKMLKRESTILMHVMDMFRISLLRSLYETTVGAFLKKKSNFSQDAMSSIWRCGTMQVNHAGSELQSNTSNPGITISIKQDVGTRISKIAVEDQVYFIKSKSWIKLINPSHERKKTILHHQRWIKINKVTNDSPQFGLHPPAHLSAGCQLQTPLWCSLNRYLPATKDTSQKVFCLFWWCVMILGKPWHFCWLVCINHHRLIPYYHWKRWDW